MAEYITKMYDRLDRICFDFYGDTKNRIVEHVMASNPHLDKEGLLLTPGLKVYLPPRPAENKSEVRVLPQIRLWGS